MVIYTNMYVAIFDSENIFYVYIYVYFNEYEIY